MTSVTHSKTIVFIHGLFMNPESWRPWIEYFEQKGFTGVTPAYPFHEGNPSVLRTKPNPELGKTTFNDVILSLSDFIYLLHEKPILIGHSMGGLAVQKLIAINKGVAGIFIEPAPPSGIFSFKWSFLKSNTATINPLKEDSVFLPTVKWYQYSFCNTMTMEETSEEYNKFVVPESRNIARSSTGKDGNINFSNALNPLLLIAGEKDHIIPLSLVKKNFEAYSDKNSRTDFNQFADRTHYICGQKKLGRSVRIYNKLD